jgi:hypothetical protein
MVCLLSNEVKWCATLGGSFSCFGVENFLVTRVLSWHFLELVRKIYTLLCLFLVPWLFLAIFLEEYKGIHPLPSFIIIVC